MGQCFGQVLGKQYGDHVKEEEGFEVVSRATLSKDSESWFLILSVFASRYTDFGNWSKFERTAGVLECSIPAMTMSNLERLDADTTSMRIGKRTIRDKSKYPRLIRL